MDDRKTHRAIPIVMDEGALSKAREEGIAVISSPLSAYALCARMAEAGIPA